MSNDPLPSRLPPIELDTLLLTFTEAVDLAEVGSVLVGYRCLLGGLERAQEADEAGEPWGVELVARYSLALERYAERWGAQVE